jgi:hypothetical protein
VLAEPLELAQQRAEVGQLPEFLVRQGVPRPRTQRPAAPGRRLCSRFHG